MAKCFLFFGAWPSVFKVFLSVLSDETGGGVIFIRVLQTFSCVTWCMAKCFSGCFVSRDPMGYVDGMGLYGGYFVPNGFDPNGFNSSTGKDGKGGGADGAGGTGGGFLDSAKRAKKDGCCFILTIAAFTPGLNYRGTGQQLWDSFVQNDNQIGHAWIKLTNVMTGEEEVHGHTGEKGQDDQAPVGGKTYKEGLRYLMEYYSTVHGGDPYNWFGTSTRKPILNDPFGDAWNPVYYLQHVYQDGRDHGPNSGHFPDKEGSVCISEKEYLKIKNYIKDKNLNGGFKPYGGFYAGCGVFAADITDRQSTIGFNMSQSARFKHTLPDTVTYNHWLLGNYTLRVATPGSPNYDKARNISYVYPDAIGDILSQQGEIFQKYYYSGRK